MIGQIIEPVFAIAPAYIGSYRHGNTKLYAKNKIDSFDLVAFEIIFLPNLEVNCSKNLQGILNFVSATNYVCRKPTDWTVFSFQMELSFLMLDAGSKFDNKVIMLKESNSPFLDLRIANSATHSFIGPNGFFILGITLYFSTDFTAWNELLIRDYTTTFVEIIFVPKDWGENIVSNI